MVRSLFLRPIGVMLALLALTIPLSSQSDELNQHLSEYQGKTLLLRGFYSDDLLRYDSSGAPSNAASGDWTVDGFVRVTAIHLSDDRLVIKAQRMVAFWSDKKQFELRPLERSKGIRRSNETVQVEANPGMHNPSPEQVDALLNKIFLTAQDHLDDLVPEYWKPCVSGGLRQTDKNCVFAPQLLSVPGVASSSALEGLKGNVLNKDPYGLAGSLVRVGNGVSPPRVTHQQEPEFSEAARAKKFQGVVVLMLVVDKEGTPRNIRISRPLGYGLDEKAVQAVSAWRFKPGHKDGMPVNVQIAVEVDFHLY